MAGMIKFLLLNTYLWDTNTAQQIIHKYILIVIEHNFPSLSDLYYQENDFIPLYYQKDIEEISPVSSYSSPQYMFLNDMFSVKT